MKFSIFYWLLKYITFFNFETDGNAKTIVNGFCNKQFYKLSLHLYAQVMKWETTNHFWSQTVDDDLHNFSVTGNVRNGSLRTMPKWAGNAHNGYVY